MERLGQFLEAIPDLARTREFQALIDAVGAISFARYWKLPGNLGKEQLDDFIEVLFDRESSVAAQVLSVVRKALGPHGPAPAPGPWDLARSVRDLVSSNADTDSVTGAVPAWRRPNLGAVAPEEATSTPYTIRDR